MLWQIRARKDNAQLNSRPSSFLGNNTSRSRPSSNHSKKQQNVQPTSPTPSKTKTEPTQRPVSNQSKNRQSPSQRPSSKQSKKEENSGQNNKNSDVEQSASETNWD